MDDEEYQKMKEKLKEKDLENIKKHLKEKEFNNIEEDEKIIEEEKSKDPKTKIIIIGAVVIVLLLIVIIMLLTKGSSSDNKENSSGGSESNTSENTTNPDEKTGINLTIAETESYFLDDNHLFVKDKDKYYVTDLEGNVIEELKGRYTIQGKYIIHTEPENERPTKYVIKTMDNGKLVEVLNTNVKSYTGYILNNNKFVGIYDYYEKGETLYIIEGAKYKTIEFGDNTRLYSLSLAEGDPLKIYNNQYGVIVKDSKYGLYDIKAEKVLITPTYEGLFYLNGDRFAFVKNGKSGIIDKTGKQLLANTYDAIAYSNDLYFVGNDTTLSVLDPNFKELGSTITTRSLSDYNYEPCCGAVNAFSLESFKDKVIVKLYNVSGLYQQAWVLDKTGNKKQADLEYTYTYGNYLVTKKSNSSVVTLYDSSLNKVADYDTKNKDTSIESAAIYLNNNFILNGKQLFELKTGKYKYVVETFSRSYQGYMVELKAKDGIATATVSLENEAIGTLNDVDVVKFLNADNNGIKVTKEYFILSVDSKNLIIKK